MSALAWLCLLGTVLGYVLGKKLHQRYNYWFLSPALFVPALIILLLSQQNIAYEQYMQGSQWIVWLLNPATVAFAIPIYRYRAVVKQHMLSIGMGIVFGMLAGLLSAYGFAKWFAFNPEITFSLMSRSVSTPFAVEVASHVNGSKELTTLFTILTGFVGMLFGDVILAVLHVKSNIAGGASLGNAAHGFGTFKAMQRHQQQGVVASLSMVLAGIFMVLCGPTLIHWVALI